MQYMILMAAVLLSFIVELIPVIFIGWYFYNRSKRKEQPKITKCGECAYHNNATGECRKINKRIQGYNTYTVNEDFCMYAEPRK